MNEAVEIELRKIIHKNTAEMELKERIDMVDMTLEEILAIEKGLTPSFRVFDEKSYDQMVFELYNFMKKNERGSRNI